MTGTTKGRVGRAVSALAVLTLTAGAVVGAVRLGPADVRPVEAGTVEVPPAPVTLQCAGPVELPQRAGRGDAAFDPTPVVPRTTLAAVSTGAGRLSVLPLGGGDPLSEVRGGGTAHLDDVDARLVVRSADRRAGTTTAATSASVVSAGDARGLAAAPCRAPANDLWLVGGSTAVGSTATLVLANPGLTAAQVELEVFGPQGYVEPTTRRHVVAAGASKVVDLGGAAADQASLVVHLSVTGGQVTAHVQDTAVRGFTPAGTDLVVPGAAPATRQVVTGVTTPATSVGSADAPVLRLLAPGEDGTTARVTILGADGPVPLAGAERVDLEPGVVTGLPLGGLPAGTYTLVVEADVPVAAAVVTSHPGTPGELDDEPRVERAWSPSTVVGVPAAVALPRGPVAHLVVAAVGDRADDTGEGTGTLRLLDAAGKVLAERDVRIDLGTTGRWAVADLAPGVAAVELVPDEDAPLVWAVVLGVEQEDGPLTAVLDPAPVSVAADVRTVREDPRPARG